jgi:hypothetical protein
VLDQLVQQLQLGVQKFQREELLLIKLVELIVQLSPMFVEILRLLNFVFFFFD